MNQVKCPKCGEVFTIDDAAYSAIAIQIKDAEFDKNVDKRVKDELKSKEQEFKAQLANVEKAKTEETSKLLSTIQELKAVIANADANAQLEKERALHELNALLEKERNDRAVEVVELKSKYEVSAKEDLLAEKEKYEEMLAEKERLLKEKDKEVEYYKDYKSRLSTKMIGESLEQYCLNEFNKIRSTAFPRAYFEKDNEVIEGGKADFVFKDISEDGVEIVSIIFDMKTESETTKTKHKNEDFFAKLDKDRQNKNVEYAVLVSTLEADNDYYNGGIADVSYRYEKMFVVRPQCFIAIIGLLTNAAKKNLAQKRELMVLQQQNADVTALEKQLEAFKKDFGQNVDRFVGNFNDAISDIDKSIKDLEKTKAALIKAQNQLNIANTKVDDMTMRKLLKNSPTLMEEYKESKKKE